MTGNPNEELTIVGPTGRVMVSRPSALWTRVTARRTVGGVGLRRLAVLRLFRSSGGRVGVSVRAVTASFDAWIEVALADALRQAAASQHVLQVVAGSRHAEGDMGAVAGVEDVAQCP